MRISGSAAAAALFLCAFCTWALSPPAGAAEVPPRYQVFTPPQALGAQSNSGEMNLGFNPTSKRYMAMAFINGSVYRVTPPEIQVPALPESCDAQWEDKTPLATSQPQVVGDPILFTDATTGRTWASNFTAGANYSYAYTSDDGESWTDAGVAPPNGGADHQTIASGPYPAGSPFKQLATANGFPNAVYFCSQAVAPNFCQRSDDGGRSYGPGIPFTNGLACGGLHGHARVGPDGDVHVPDKSCGGGRPGYSVSSNAGLSWKDIPITSMTTGSEDPSIGVASDGSLYFCNVNADGEPVVAVSKDKGATWSAPFNIGAAQGIKNAVFTNAIAGDPDRAACAFIGTTTDGNSGGIDFTGVWHPYIAHTYDGGATWTTINISPDDPVQGVGGICRSGTTCMSTPDNRNLLDFNEITIDHNGRPAYGYDDGCTGDCVLSPTVAPATRGAFGAQIKIARQYGGRTLFAARDASYPDTGAPNQACLAGTRTIAQSALSWNPPDNGGRPITGYSIFRSTTAGSFGSQPIAVTNNASTRFDDFTQDPDVSTYFYKIVARNDLGAGPGSNVLPLALSQPENICLAPGLTVLNDPANDIFSGITPTQGSTPFYDVRSLSISQPYFDNGDYKIAFHLRMTSLATVPVGATWPVSFCSPAFSNCTDPNVAVSATNKYYTVRMTTAGGPTPSFELLAPNEAGITRTTTVLPATGGSKFDPNGLITIVVNAADIGLAPASAGTQTLTRFLSRINAGAVTPDNMPDSLVGEGRFKTATLNLCGPNAAPVSVLSATPLSGRTPLLVSFSGSASADSDAGDTIASYTFDFGDGSETVTQTGAAISHSYAMAGNYNAALKVRDSRGMASAFDSVVHITANGANSAPVALLTAAPVSGTAPLTVRFDASSSSDPDLGDRVVSYSYDLDGDGVFELVDSAGSEPSFTYNTVGSYLAKLKVKDVEGLESAVVTRSITVSEPSASPLTIDSFTASPSTGDVTNGPLTVTFNVSVTDTDANKGTVSYTYYYGDGTHSERLSSPSSSHVYERVGRYPASVIVADDAANSATAETAVVTTSTVTVNPGAAVTAVLSASLPNGSQVPATAILDGSGSTSYDGAIYRFDFGDGTSELVSTAKLARHAYTIAGSYTVTLTVTDRDDSSNSSTATATVMVTAAQQTVAQLSISPSTTTVGRPVAFDASASIARTGSTITRYVFDFGDGSSQDSAAATATHAYTRTGSFTPSVTVYDSSNASSISKAAVKVLGPATGSGTSTGVVTTPHFGGALPLWTLLSLLLVGLRRRRR